MTTDDINRTAEIGSAGVHALSGELGDRPTRREMNRSMLAAGVLGALLGAIIAIVVALNTSSDVDDLRLQRATDKAISRTLNERQDEQLARLADQAFAGSRQDNRTLERRGQEPVDVPDPDNSEPADVIAAAAAAKVLATLPTDRQRAEELGAAIADYITRNPQGPTRATLASLIADYLRANPPPAGPEGKQGEQGVQGEPAPPPTAADLLLAVEAHCVQQPGGTCEGEPGRDGDRGPMGPAGKSCPEGWAFKPYTDERNPLDPEDDISMMTCQPE